MKKKYYLLLLIMCGFFIILNSQEKVHSNEGYVGMDVCKGCHGNIYSEFIKNVHGKKTIPGNPASREGCESCHGPGSEHVSKGGGKGVAIIFFNKKEAAKKKSFKCLACHEETRSVAFWDMSRHKSFDVSCDGCHSIHYAREKNLKESEPELCYGCHKDVRSQSNKQSHHPIQEKKILCTACHNPMGSFGIKMVKADSVNELCYKCHAEKRGPFLWEHPPVVEKCTNCHVPHGSNHAKLLFRKAHLLCHSCHDTLGHLGNLHTQFESFKGSNTRNFFVARSCLNCHTNIHGSNGPSARGSHFLR